MSINVGFSKETRSRIVAVRQQYVNKDPNGYYRKARGPYSQEAWAEMVGMSTRAVQEWEAGHVLPPNCKVIEMIRCGAAPILAFQHMENENELFRQYFQPIRDKGLAESALSTIKELQDVVEDQRDLIDIARDGKITPDETERRDRITTNIRELMTELAIVLCALETDAE